MTGWKDRTGNGRNPKFNCMTCTPPHIFSHGKITDNGMDEIFETHRRKETWENLKEESYLVVLTIARTKI
jgi:hypothetical protein